MTAPFRPALAIFLGLTALTGFVYPVAVTAAARLCFPRQAAGSLLTRRGEVVGSALIGQHTEDPRLFWGRLSATGDGPANPLASGGSNASNGHPGLRAAAQRRLQALQAADPGNREPVPSDLVTASGSGLDPHISPRAAWFQTARVARNRGLAEAQVADLVARCTEKPQWGLFGEPRVNVLKLNLALEERP